MSSTILSIKFRNLYGNIVSGCCLIALGVWRVIAPASPALLGFSILLLVLAGINLWSCLSKSREHEDEMAERDSSHAAAIALWTTLSACGITGAFGVAFGLSVDLASATYVFIGFALVVYGVTFSWLERAE